MKRGKIIYTGDFMDWLIANFFVFLICVILAVPSLGISILYLGYYQIKYFVARLEIQIES
ncbi:MAG: hypothetical protein ACRCXZ_04610 [Patescibacteria group bacterium]